MPRGRYLSAMLVGLAAIAGWVDALSFIELGKVFTSFQSGNLIFLGVGVADGNGGLLGRAAVSLAVFVAGSAGGAYVLGRAGIHDLTGRAARAVLMLEWLLLAAFAIGWQAVGDPASHTAGRLVLIGLAAGAMGVQGALVLALRMPGVMTNAMTATLNLLGTLAGLRARSSAAERDASPASAGLLILLCASYAVSAVIVGAIGRPEVTCFGPALAFAAVVVALTERRRRPVTAG